MERPRPINGEYRYPFSCLVPGHLHGAMRWRMGRGGGERRALRDRRQADGGTGSEAVKAFFAKMGPLQADVGSKYANFHVVAIEGN